MWSKSTRGGAIGAVSPSLLYAGSWRRFCWSGITLVEKVKAHQKEVQLPPATPDMWTAYVNQRADHWAGKGRELHDLKPSDVSNYKRLIKKVIEHLSVATNRIAAYPKANDLKEIAKLPLDPRPVPPVPPEPPERRRHSWWRHGTHWRCKHCLRLSFDQGSSHKLAVNSQECEGVTSSLRSITHIGKGHDIWMANVGDSQHRMLFYCRLCWGYAEKQAKRLTQPCKLLGPMS